MRIITILTLLFTFAIITQSQAGHSRGNGTCTDDAVHYQNMIANDKRSDAPLYEQSKAMRDKANAERVTGDVLKCEEYYEEALRMIRKPYPSE